MKRSKDDGKIDLKDVGRGWAWRIHYGLCNWAEPSDWQLRLRDKADRRASSKPSPEATSEPVFIVPRATWLQIRRALPPPRKKKGKAKR